MGHHTSPYWIFRSGEALVDVLLRLADILFTPLTDLSFFNTRGVVIDIAADLFGWDFLDYSIFDLVVGPGLSVLVIVVIARWFKNK